MSLRSVRGFTGSLVAIALAIVLSIVGILTFPFAPHGGGYFVCARFWAWAVFKVVGTTVRFEGREKVDFTQAQFYMCNHQSHVDILALFLAIQGPVRMLSKKSLAYVPIFGWGMAIAGFVFIDRHKRDKAFESIDRAAARIADGHSVVVFPEGTRSSTGVVAPFKKGGFVLAEQAKVPIVPIGITGSLGMLPKGAFHMLPSEITVRFGDPIATSGLERDEILARTHRAICALAKDAPTAAMASRRVVAASGIATATAPATSRNLPKREVSERADKECAE